jgi:hypothetical protein
MGRSLKINDVTVNANTIPAAVTAGPPADFAAAGQRGV